MPREENILFVLDTASHYSYMLGMFLRRIGSNQSRTIAECVGCRNCPDIWELIDGDFAVIGADITEVAAPHLPATAGCGPGERIVRLPRKLLVDAKLYIPGSV
jgi:hypothetical protein